ncbi:unnamed protein product [Rhizoctonia solani]|uniref:Armadillo repeat-containing protein 8 n=1 Tax=Rhizoctonia solani TaxID=456999 RepID=A0A8H2X3S5_9AGAM|nr:unnamed protein product [Rhizoctonia solani]
MVDANATLETLRGIKNTIIGNPTQKKELATDGTLRRVLDWVNAGEHTTDPIFEHIRIEAAHIIAAQSYGPPEALVSVLEAQAPQALLTALKDERTKSSPRLALALTRALRAVLSAAAETIGPGRWHFLRDPAHPARMEARLVLEDMFSVEALDVILPYLSHPEPDVRRNVAILLARGICSDAHRTRIADYEGRSAVWALIGMLGGDIRNQSAATFALAEITRDNETMSRILTDRIPLNVLSYVINASVTGSHWNHTVAPVEPERPSIHIPGSEPSLISSTRPSRASDNPDQLKDEHLRVLDMIGKFLPSRNGDLREAACLCISNITRQARPSNVFRDQIHGMVMWLNLALEEFVPSPDSSFQISVPESIVNPDPKLQWMQKCRWKPNEIGGGEVARRVVGACYILADFVNDREDLLVYVSHAGTLQRAVRALLTLPPIPIPPGKPAPALSGRWGPGSSSSPSSGVPAPITQPLPPPTTTRSRRISSTSRGPGGYEGVRGRVGAPSLSPVPPPPPPIMASIPPITSPVPPPITSPVPPPITSPVPPSPGGAQTSPTTRRRLSFAELARRGSSSETGVQTFMPRAPSRVRRTSSSTGVVPEGVVVGSAGVGAGGSGEGGVRSGDGDAVVQSGDTGVQSGDAGIHPGNAVVPSTDAMVVDSESTRTNEDVAMAAPPPANPQPVDVVMTIPAPPSAAPTRRRRKPPPDPALGPYTFSTSTPVPSNPPTPSAPVPPAPESSLRAALLVLLASLTMHSEEHRRLLVEAGGLGSVLPARRTGGGGGLKSGELEGVTGALGAMGSSDPEVRWAGVMLGRSVGRSTGVLRTGLYDSGIGRAMFDMLMKGEPDKRVLVAVLRMCCNLLNQYSPMREMFIRDGGMQKLAELCDAEEQTIRHLALWGFKNTLFRATSEDTRTLMSILRWDRLERALDEQPGEALEQALMIVRNITHHEPDAEWLITHLPPTKLINAAERTLGTDDSASVAALFALAHTSYIPSVRQLIVGRRRVLEYIRSSLAHSEVTIRSAAALCVAHMAGCMPRRLREMREVGMDGQLKVLRGRELDEEVRENVARALSFFEMREG